MHAGALKTLEFDRIVEAVRRFAQTPPGAARLAKLQPLTESRGVASALAATAETARFLRDQQIALRAPEDLEALLVSLAVEGRILEPASLVSLATFLSSVDATCGSIRRTRASFPILASIAETSTSFEHEIADIRRKIGPSLDVVDDASPELASIRDRLRKQRARLRGTLESYLRGRDTSKYLQQQIVTDRNGRYVLVVRSEHRAAIPGIIHGSSGSGASLYLEPLSTVELNNEVVALEEREAAEVHRILLALTDAFRARALEVRRTLDAAADFDVIQAKARFAGLCRASAPTLATDGRLELRAARHPLLIPGVLARTEDEDGRRVSRDSEPSPVDIHVIPPTRVLIVTGPNTGGKTVALKAAGLLALMTQSGLHIPAEEGSTVPVFQSVFADIGDEQSIAANLSTFSWHITNIAAMDRALRAPALVLLDEVGAGTDPVEGGALGMAIIDHFRQRGAIVIATTHYDALKSYASTTPEVVAAAFGFHPETFVPTYRLMYGSPGSSLALEMAQRVGLPLSIVEAARGFRSDREAQLAEHLAKIDRDLHALDHERRLVSHERARLGEIDAQVKARDEALRNREAQFRLRLDNALQERLREARREIDAIVDEVRRKAAAMAEDAARKAQLAPRLAPGFGSGLTGGRGADALLGATPSTGETGGLKAEARAALDVVTTRLRRGSEEPAPTVAVAVSEPATPPPPVAPGMRVALPLGIEGIVQAVHDRTVDVSVNGKRMRANLDELRVLGPVQAAASRVTVHVNAHAREGSVTDLNVVGCSVAEALDRADKFLDQALMAEQRQVRVIHGHGTGQLRRALAEFLSDHPLVLRIESAPPNQGGGGVTMVELKE
jgi:DNA mismatch repair protein MutS2